MIAGLLALMLVSADTTTRHAPVDSMQGGSAAGVASVSAVALPDDTSASHAPVRIDSLITVAPSLPFAVARIDADVRLRRVTPDTVIRKKPRLVEYSEWYGRRVAIHKALSWAMLPLFAVSYYTGEQLARDGRDNVPTWVRTAHPYVATADAAIFGVNTVTGVWNLIASRHDANGRTRRIVHSVLFLAADAGFAYAGSIGKDGRENGAIRSRHRTIALSSMGVSTAGWLIMLIGQ